MSSSALGRVFGLSQYLPIIPARSKSGSTKQGEPDRLELSTVEPLIPNTRPRLGLS